MLPVAEPLTLALMVNDVLTLADAEAAAVTWPAKLAAADKQAAPCAVSCPPTSTAVVAIAPIAVAATLPLAATCTRSGRLVSRVVFREADAVPVTVTLTDGFVQTIFAEAEPSQPALQFAAASHFGGVRATSQDGALMATEHEPLQLPSHFAVALAVALQLPWQVPSHVPLHWPFAVVAVPVPEAA